jgi:hypothetical protein
MCFFGYTFSQPAQMFAVNSPLPYQLDAVSLPAALAQLVVPS